MVSFFFLLLQLFINYGSAQNSNLCVWGATVLNGQYLYSGMHNNYPYYIMAVDTTCSSTGQLFLFYSNSNDWQITEVLEAITFYEYCPNSIDPTTGTGGGCVNKWQDANMQVTYGSCPEWDCDEITTSWPSTHPCGATFDTRIEPNVYRASSNGVYFYYALGDFVCADEYSTACKSSVWDFSTDSWSDLLKGTSIDITFEGAGLETVYCIGYTESPTTNSPNTNFPTTMFPTTAMPTTSMPPTAIPTTSMSTTYAPIPTTTMPTITMTTTSVSTTSMPTTAMPTAAMSTTAIPTTTIPTTVAPTTKAQTTFITTFVPTIPSTKISTTGFPTTAAPVTNEEQVSEEEASTTISSDNQFHSQNKEPFVQSQTFFIVIICIAMMLICCSVILTVFVFLKKRKQNKNPSMVIKHNIELAQHQHQHQHVKSFSGSGDFVHEHVTPFGSNQMRSITPFTPFSPGSAAADRMRVKSMSEHSDAKSVGDGHGIVEEEENIYGEGNDDGSGDDIYQPCNTPLTPRGIDYITPLTPRGVTADNDD